jgi:Tfp pilus assembly protein PilO
MSAGNRRVLLWTAAMLGAVNLVLFFTYTAPRAARKRDVAARTAALDTELTRQRERLKDLRDRAETISANRKDARTFMATVAPEGAGVVPVLSEVESLARQQGLRVGTQTFSREPVKGLGIERFGIVMPVQGDYRQVTGMIGALESSPTFVTLDKISAQAGQGIGGQEQVGLDMEFSYYFRARVPEGTGR